jgi:hypothetical protein
VPRYNASDFKFLKFPNLGDGQKNFCQAFSTDHEELSPDIGMVEGITVYILVSDRSDAVGALQLVRELPERSKP